MRKIGRLSAAMGIYKEAGVIAMSPSATNPDLTLSGEYPNFFRTIAHDAVQAQLQVKFATSVLKVKKVAVLHDKGDYGKGQAELARKYAEGFYAIGPMDISDNPLAVQAKKEHQEEFGKDPGAFFDAAYAAAISLLNGIEKAGSTDYAAVVKALKSEFVETPLGKISFDDNGDATGIGFSVYQVKDGAFVEQN